MNLNLSTKNIHITEISISHIRMLNQYQYTSILDRSQGSTNESVTSVRRLIDHSYEDVNGLGRSPLNNCC